jgi:nucleoid-associated protein YgaU
LTDAPRQALETINSNNTNLAEATAKANKIASEQPMDTQAVQPVQVPQAVATIETPLLKDDNSVSVSSEGIASNLTTSEANQAASEAINEIAAEKQLAAVEPEQVASDVKTYTVKKGDTLAAIAAKFYGSEGKKKSAIDLIVKENNLKSAKQISIGQKLVIPENKGLDATEPSFFEKVELMGKKTLGLDTNSSSETPKKEVVAVESTNTTSNSGTTEYVVKAGDTPVKIAAKQLGDSSRYKEILKCNPGLNPNRLSIGMRLKLPER